MNETPTLDEIRAATQVLLECGDAQALKNGAELAMLQTAIDKITAEEYTDFYLRGLDYTPDELASIYERLPVLHFYDAAFEKVLDATANFQVPAGKVLLLYLYNLGYVVKTPTQCLGIDIHHRQAERLVPYLDFCLVTHNHSDHCTPKFLAAMNKAGKKIYSSFYPSYEGYTRMSERTVEIGELTIHCYQSDHNKYLPGFVTPFELVCGKGSSPCVIFTSGDSCRASQLRHKSKEVTFHIVHPYVGLDVVEAYKDTVHGRTVLVNHLQELQHPKDRYRWTFADGFAAADKLNAAGANTIVPLWGTQILWQP